MPKNKGGRGIYFIIILIIILLSLNTGKFILEARSVTNYFDFEQSSQKSKNLVNNLKNRIENTYETLKPNNLIYVMTGIQPRIPMTYLKREIPFLTYYNPDSIEREEKVIYQSQDSSKSDGKNNVIKLEFDLRKQKSNPEPRKVPTETKKTTQKNTFTNDQKVIAIYHTHTSETYMDDPREQDNNGHVRPGKIGNVAQAGRELARVLSSKYNYQVIHITRVHDESYSHSYLNSRKTVKSLLSEHKNIDLILDIHRNGIEKATRADVVTTISGARTAKIMLVVTNGKFEFAHLDFNTHLEWKRNLNLAEDMAKSMENIYPGLLHRIEIKDRVYNQDLHPRSLLIEMGDYRNTTGEALQAARLLADVIAEMLN